MNYKRRGHSSTFFFPRMPEAHGKARLENQVKMLIMGNEDVKKTSQKGGESALGNR